MNVSFGIKRKWMGKNTSSKPSKRQKKEEKVELDEDDLLDKDTKIERELNHIYFHSEVDRDSIFDLSSLIREAEEECVLMSLRLNIPEIPIYLHINSLGGSVFAALTAIDIIQGCKVPIHTIIEGSTASSGTLMSVVGAKRYIRPNAYMLIHELSSEFWGKMGQIEDEVSNLQELMKKIKDIYTKNTSFPKKELLNLLKHDLWLNAEKCLEYGLVDEIWKK